MNAHTSWLSAPLNRGTAFAIHLILSLLVFSTLVLMMVLYWFPGELFLIDGGWQGLKLVAMVDLVLGPALTLILYKPGKPKLLFDLSIIVAVQIAALMYGFYATHSQRTLAVVYAEDGFMTLRASEHRIANDQLAEIDVQAKPIPPAQMLKLPLLVTPPHENLGEYLADIFNGYPEAGKRSDLYVPMADGRDAMDNGRHSVEQLKEEGTLEIVNQVLAKRALTMSVVEVYPFKARYASGLVLFDPEALRIIDYIPIPIADKSDETIAADEPVSEESLEVATDEKQ